MLTASLVLFLLCGLWFWLQQKGRAFARRHPEFGRYREEGGECGKTCGCAIWKHCQKKSEAGGQKSEAGIAQSPHHATKT
ncbi:MAG: chemotaxis protein [Kiritimatiellia bacterium]